MFLVSGAEVDDILRLDATDQITALKSGAISAADLLEMSIARGDEVAGRLNAVVARDLDGARSSARAIDAARARGEDTGLLAGLPMAVKDSFDVAGLPASSGLEVYTGRTCEDAVVVARSRAAGGVIWGKTNLPVLAGDWQSYNRLYGTTNNPWDVSRTCGGSSGGSAAILASQAVALEIGSDIGGSLRIPAGFCGVFAHKPTFGLVAKKGQVPPAPGTFAESDLSVVGPMARSARDLTLLLHIMSAGETPATVSTPRPADLRIGLWLDDPAMFVDTPVRDAILVYAERARAAGFKVEPVRPVDGDELLETYNMLLMAQMGAGFSEAKREEMMGRRAWALAERAAGAGPLSQAARVLGITASHHDFLIANEARWRLDAQVEAAFERFDVILSPVSPVDPFPHDHSRYDDRVLAVAGGGTVPYETVKTWSALAIACGQPATSIPAGFSSASLPVGVQLIGPRGRDIVPLAAAQALEASLGGFVPPPI